jgi:ADP-ribose pyrophosphatase YjhB (NUDIX family)
MRLAAGIAVVTREEDPALLLGWRSAYIRRYPGVLAFPGGMANHGESLIGAALRELREEAVLSMPIRDISDAVKHSFTVTTDRLAYTTFVAVVPEPFPAAPANWENDGFEWVRRSETRDLPPSAFHPDVHQHLHRVWP